MSQSQRLSQADLRRGFRLVGEVGECADDTIAWRSHLTAGLCLVVGATKGFTEEEIVAPEPAGSAIAGVVIHGFDAADLKIFATFAAEGHFHISPMFPVVQPIATRPWTHVRREIVPDDGLWYRHRMTDDYMRPTDVDDCIHSRQPLPGAPWSHMCNVFRPRDARPFSVRERRLVHLVHEEVARLWHRPAPPDPVDALPPRLGQVVRRLRAGDSEKQIALRLGLTRQTVHGYAKTLHRRFAVSNRYDLLARLAPPPSPRRLRLSSEASAAGDGR